MTGIARWCFRHRFIVFALWLSALVALAVGSSAAGGKYKDDFSLPGSESTKALTLLEDSFPALSGESDIVVWRTNSGSVGDPSVKARMTNALNEIKKLDHVAEVTSPYVPAGAGQTSEDGRTAFATVNFDVQGDKLSRDTVKDLLGTVEGARTTGLTVEISSPAVSLVQAEERGGNVSELVGLLAAVVILLLAFGSMLAMLLPIAIALLALGSALMTIGLASHALDIATFVPALGTLIGLGVGIDYALFIVTRYRAGLQGGLGTEEAAVSALGTAGRAVVFAGGTVCIALMGLLVLNMSFLTGMAVASSIIVLFTVIAAVTLLPAMLGLFGTRVLSRRQRRRLAADGPRRPESGHEPRTGVWARWAEFGARHPAVLAGTATVVMVVLVLPVFSLRLGFSDQSTQPESSTSRKAYELLADAFGPGFSGPLQLVAEVRSPADKAVLERLSTQVRGVEGVAAASPVTLSPDGSVGVVQVVPTGSPQDEATSDLIERLREDVVPAAERGGRTQVLVGGSTALTDDFSASLSAKLPLFVAVIVVLGGLLLLVAFRSVLVPVAAAAMNLLAAGTTFGVIVPVFQWGWGENLLDLGQGPIEAFQPVFMLAILFGLSMDYQVFLVSRVHEEWERTGDNRRSVIVGQTDTSRVITAAATIMICVFGAFVLSGQRVLAEVGFGLAAGIALDAFVLRTMLVPSIMHLLGRANWWIPRRLERVLPRVSFDGPRPVPDAPADGRAPQAAQEEEGRSRSDRLAAQGDGQ
ncbi:RND superfamily putative drug exporter [Actinomadura pelletieri DSM 43383]|uniref:RND superfamily putative drug exporter n=1 Tax=Actinomadura pelletieri DSM 43383 TaxID=1120940 RepID=A0A495Q9P9_9ACTN|nr:MMPL family transporter [Actinomadura pelletieri]RKS68187.1 RND superfamily putative drug exporter [Actinomadura pelletieri DSM 43383]